MRSRNGAHKNFIAYVIETQLTKPIVELLIFESFNHADKVAKTRRYGNPAEKPNNNSVINFLFIKRRNVSTQASLLKKSFIIFYTPLLKGHDLKKTYLYKFFRFLYYLLDFLILFDNLFSTQHFSLLLSLYLTTK